MEIISTTDVSRYGNDCYINRSITLVKQFGIYAVITFQKITGWFEDEYVGADYMSNNYEDAIKFYKENGGILEH